MVLVRAANCCHRFCFIDDNYVIVIVFLMKTNLFSSTSLFIIVFVYKKTQ